MKCERQLEDLRVRLARRPYFSIRAAFSLVDRDADGFLRGCDLRDFLADHGFYATERELAGLMARMDTDKDNRICFGEFSEQFMPRLMKGI